MSTKLNKRQRIAAELIGLGHRPSAVASQLNVSRETISRWRQLPTFNEQSQKAHLDLLVCLLADRLQLIDRCHGAISNALSCKDTSKAIKAGVALRYLALTGSPSQIYHGIKSDQGRLATTDENNKPSLEWIFDTIDKLYDLKNSNGHLSDAQYRNKAEAIVSMPEL